MADATIPLSQIQIRIFTLMAASQFLSSAIASAVGVGGGWCNRNSADLMISQAIYEYVNRLGAHACVMLVSGDAGFARLLAFCRSRGCTTIVLGR